MKTISKRRKLAITKEAERRLNLWLQHSSFEEMSLGGSFIRFVISLGMIGYPFEKKEWMDKSDFKRFITDVEFDSQDCEEIHMDLYKRASVLNLYGVIIGDDKKKYPYSLIWRK